MNNRKTLYVEVCQKSSSTLSHSIIEAIVENAFGGACGYVRLNKNLLARGAKAEWSKFSAIKENLDSIICTTNDGPNDNTIATGEYEHRKFFVYKLSQEEVAMESIQHESEELNVASHIILPSKEYYGLWESLYYPTNIKSRLLDFIETILLFSDRGVDRNIISLNKVVLLHGLPGTGKTSLCKALAQKAAIRLGHRYSHVELIEINSHSLFSKWFSESGKLVMKLFDEVRRLLENPDSLVCVLIDEVESLAHCRKSSANGTEPSDAIRVVNSLLTQLDQIKSYPNVLILTTSNVTEAIDLAFVDRADIKEFVPHPDQRATYQIYKSCLEELMRVGLVEESELCDVDEVFFGAKTATPKPRWYLEQISERSVGLSGRTLRKIPFLTHAEYIQSSNCTLDQFLGAMEKIIDEHHEQILMEQGNK